MIKKLLGAYYKDVGLLVLRLGLGGMFIWHGWPKISGGPEMWAKLGGAMTFLGVSFMPEFWGFMSASAEFFGGICVVSGLFFRPACIFLTINLAVAANMHLGKGDGLLAASHAIEDGIVFLSLSFIGPGKYALDEKLFRVQDT